MKILILFLIFLLLLVAMIFPFLPGEYDALSNPVAIAVQLFSGLGLLTCIPAILWFFDTISHRKEVDNRRKLYPKIYVWTAFFAGLVAVLFTALGLSLLLGLFLLASLVFFTRFILRKIAGSDSGMLFSYRTPLSLVMFPVILLAFQVLIDKPLANWSKSRAIYNSRELINEIERYKLKYGSYPLTLNAEWKDYKTGVIGIEKYYYTYDDTSYNLYFEQPRFLFDQFGTREFVVYNPKGNHLMLSHASWHMLLGPQQRRATQGWYASYNTGVAHWKYFLFD